MKTKYYDHLPDEAVKLRKEVFVDEQGFREEFGDDDGTATHIVLFDDGGTPVATARVIKDVAGRIAVCKRARGKGYGKLVVQAAEKAVYENGYAVMKIHAQKRAVGFYEKIGYTAYGDWEPDEGCPHIWMKKKFRMDIGINMGCRPNISFDESLELMKENGFGHTFFGSWSTCFDELADKVERAGVITDALHAPFGSDGVCNINDIWHEGEAGDRMLKRLMQGVERCSARRIPTLVVHLSTGDVCPHVNDIGHARFARLMEAADSAGVEIAFENQRKLSNIAYAFEEFPTARFCWDTGHEAALSERPRDYMQLFGHKLSALHIHDNDCVHGADLHLLPYDGKIDFENVAKRIADSNWNGTLMLEVISRNSDRYEEITDKEYYARAGSAAKKLQERVLKLRYAKK